MGRRVSPARGVADGTTGTAQVPIELGSQSVGQPKHIKVLFMLI
jgi:hypothetical protein